MAHRQTRLTGALTAIGQRLGANMHYQPMRPIAGKKSQFGYVVWQSFHDQPRYGAGVFETRAEAEAVIAQSYRTGQYITGELEVRTATFAPPAGRLSA